LLNAVGPDYTCIIIALAGMWQLRKINDFVTVPYRKPKPLEFYRPWLHAIPIKGETSHTFILNWIAFRSLIDAFDNLL